VEIESKPSLYDRLGGVYNIAVMVDDLIDRVMVDPRLNANPRVDEAIIGYRRRGSNCCATTVWSSVCQACVR
jgi:hypothetical protein